MQDQSKECFFLAAARIKERDGSGLTCMFGICPTMATKLTDILIFSKLKKNALQKRIEKESKQQTNIHLESLIEYSTMLETKKC